MDSRIIGGRLGNKFLLAGAIDRLINILVTASCLWWKYNGAQYVVNARVVAAASAARFSFICVPMFWPAREQRRFVRRLTPTIAVLPLKNDRTPPSEQQMQLPFGYPLTLQLSMDLMRRCGCRCRYTFSLCHILFFILLFPSLLRDIPPFIRRSSKIFRLDEPL